MEKLFRPTDEVPIDCEDHLSEAIIRMWRAEDVFYDGQSSLCEWISSPGFDFYVIEKQPPCPMSTNSSHLQSSYYDESDGEISHEEFQAPHGSRGSILGRGTSLIVSNATAFSHRVSDDLPAVPCQVNPRQSKIITVKA